MKKVMVGLLAMTFMLGVTAFAQQDTMAQRQADSKAAAVPLMTLKGTVKAEGDKSVS